MMGGVDVTAWLLDSDPALRTQVLRDLLDAGALFKLRDDPRIKPGDCLLAERDGRLP